MYLPKRSATKMMQLQVNFQGDFYKFLLSVPSLRLAQSAWAVKYTDDISAKG